MRYATWTALALLASAGSAAAREAASAGDAGAAWLAGLQDGVAKDLLAGRPLVIETHVALCDNRIIPCGNLGNGDRPVGVIAPGEHVLCRSDLRRVEIRSAVRAA